MDLDPDPRRLGTDPGSGSGSWKFIRILADLDPQHWRIRIRNTGESGSGPKWTGSTSTTS
jgi:hypothetical protein